MEGGCELETIERNRSPQSPSSLFSCPVIIPCLSTNNPTKTEFALRTLLRFFSFHSSRAYCYASDSDNSQRDDPSVTPFIHSYEFSANETGSRPRSLLSRMHRAMSVSVGTHLVRVARRPADRAASVRGALQRRLRLAHDVTQLTADDAVDVLEDSLVARTRHHRTVLEVKPPSLGNFCVV